jgi:hypothetical protein
MQFKNYSAQPSRDRGYFFVKWSVGKKIGAERPIWIQPYTISFASGNRFVDL